MDELRSMPSQWERELARFREENESLRAQLEDSQETLRAIREGAVDALVIDTPQGPRVFTLQGGEHPYRALIEQMREGAATLTPEGVIHYCNQRCAEMFKLPLEWVVGGRMEDFVAPADRAALASILREGAGRTELALRAHDATEVPVLVSAISLRAEGPAAVCLVVTDLTERKRHEAEIHQLNDITTMANQSQNTEQAIEYCLRRVAMYNGWCFGDALLSAADNADELVPAHAYYAEDPDRFRRFREVTFGLRVRRGQGMPGRVLASGKLEWTTDLRGDLTERRALLAEELGIGTAVAFPVLLGEKVAAVLEFFSDRVIQPDSRIADAMVGVGLQLGRVIERAEFEEHLLTIAEEIQRGISQDLHDDVGQELTGLGLKAQTLAEMLAPAKTPAGDLAADIIAALERTHDKVRGLCRGTLPIELEEGLLSGALEQLAVATSGSSRISCGFTCPYPDPVFDSRVSVHLYRIAQEAVANALRHSGAQGIQIMLEQEEHETVLRIEDDGKGLSTKPATARGMGLRTMRYRAGLIGGKLEVGPGPRGGTQVICRLDAPPENAELEK